MPEQNDLIFHRHKRNLPSKKNIPPNRCEWPWKGINIDRLGRIFICGCDAWVPYPIGHVLEFESLPEIMSSPVAKMIQESISQGEYEYCDTFHCGVASAPKKIACEYEIHIGIDDSCNLHCPSCRDKMIFRDDDEYVNERKQWLSKIQSWVHKEKNKRINILIGSNGEPFASPVYREFLKSEFQSNVRYEIRSNGTLIKRYIDSLSVLPNLRTIRLSIDAASAEVYEKVRKPAKWSTLLENINYLNSIKDQYHFKIFASYVIQKENLDDVLPFINFCIVNNIDSYDFTLLQDWSSFPNFAEHAVHLPDNILHNKFLQIIKDPLVQKLSSGWLANY